ncbi:hypothetical protein X805_30340 [Sphaerotilus natans subsp. natans DSM 6575]|uniref:Uncharacterized protein n=1 Tax=Sphaerotilus natans subsp. natans DSM 6575 TaxID=1286631 RepID=A0A059KJ25_9BURK|nr:hypothetical protein X805_30340 [Sphaerotilus natans subsp. natans DSM 6575]
MQSVCHLVRARSEPGRPARMHRHAAHLLLCMQNGSDVGPERTNMNAPT